MTNQTTLQLRKVVVCVKCGSWYEQVELKEIEKAPLDQFHCKYCKKGDYWDLRSAIQNQENDRMVQSSKTKKWYTEFEWGDHGYKDDE